MRSAFMTAANLTSFTSDFENLKERSVTAGAFLLDGCWIAGCAN